MAPLLIFFLLQFPSLLPLSAAYNLPNRFFINCGSSSSVSINGQDFTGDVNPVNSLSAPSSGRTRTVQDPGSSSADQLYGSARVFTETSSYEFGIDDPGSIHVVRFHFLHFPSLGNSSDVRFHVSASGTRLLTNFTVGVRNFTHLPPIEEFLLTIPSGKLKIDFAPSGKGFIAFVNAIEVFLAPPELLPDSNTTITEVTPEREGKDFNDLPDNVLRVIHRINVGGPNIMPSNDTLLRYWIPDDNVGFMINRIAARNSQVYNGRLNYGSGGATQFDAPDNVYRTAKQMNIVGDGRASEFNVSWRFGVNRGAQHLVRLHFCDVVSNTTNEFVRFNLYIYSTFRDEVWPFDITNGELAQPFYKEYVVRSDNSGFMNISIGPSADSRAPTTAFLNGVEIMELIGSLSGSGSSSSRRQKLVIIGSSVGGGVLVLALVALSVWFSLCRKKKLEAQEAYDWPLIQGHGGSSYSRTTNRTVNDTPLADLNLGLKLSFSEILYATNKFDPKFMVGKGGFGKVYKGMLRNGRKVAVKRSEPEHGQGADEFQTEIVILSKIRHHHLVSLIGYCNEGDEMILVYEFMEKGTLREHLYITEADHKRESASGSKLCWEDRLKICLGAAKGLNYLHTGSKIIHRDVKSTNILLDENYVGKVADFGLSHPVPDNGDGHVMTQVKGSFGYLDPEYCELSQLTEKSDVYSFGVVLLEVLCARPALDRSLPREQVNLAEWGLSQIRKGELDKIVDELLVGKINPNCLRKFAETVEKCLKHCGVDRPKMVDVLWDLEYCLKLQHTVTAQAPYNEDSATNIAMVVPVPVFQRLGSDTMVGDGTMGLQEESEEFSQVSQGEAENVFSQLKLGEPR